MEVSGLGPKFVLGIAAFLLAFHLGMRYVITYRLTDSRLEVLLFGFLPVSMTRRAPQSGRPPVLYFRALLTEGGDQRVRLHRA